MADTDQTSQRARALRDTIEPAIGSVYFSPECHDEYAALGFNPSPMSNEGVAMPDGPAYFCSRGSCMGQVPGEMVAAAFAVFNPAIVVPLVDAGWKIADAPTLAAARRRGAVGQLRRILGEPDELKEMGDLLAASVDGLPPAGRPLYAGLLSLDEPDDPWGRFFHAGDLIREFRGDSHTAAWNAAGFDAIEIGLLTELFWGIPTGTYIRTRAWSDEEISQARQRLTDRGFIDAEGQFTDAGRAAREAVEVATDLQMRVVVERLDDDYDRVTDVIGGWSQQVIKAGGYPGAATQILGRS